MCFHLMGCHLRLNDATIFASSSCAALTSQALVSISSPSQHLKARQLPVGAGMSFLRERCTFHLGKEVFFPSPPHWPLHFDRTVKSVCVWWGVRGEGGGTHKNQCEYRWPQQGWDWTGTPAVVEAAGDAGPGVLFRHPVACVVGGPCQPSMLGTWR